MPTINIQASVGGLGFLEPMLRLDSGYSEIAVNPDGGVCVVKKGKQDFVKLNIQPSETDVWRVVETLLAPLQRTASEASPSVDAKIPRSPALPSGARLKILHPVIAPSDGYPSINIRLFEQAREIAILRQKVDLLSDGSDLRLVD